MVDEDITILGDTNKDGTPAVTLMAESSTVRVNQRLQISSSLKGLSTDFLAVVG